MRQGDQTSGLPTTSPKQNRGPILTCKLGPGRFASSANVGGPKRSGSDEF